MTYEIYNEDCLEGMKRLESGSIDLILTDLPYGSTSLPQDVRVPFEPMWTEFLRVTKENAAIVLFSQMPFGSDLIQSQRKLFRYEISWEKSVPVGFFNANKMPLRCHENILIFYRRLPTYNPQFRKGKSYAKRAIAGLHKNYGKVKEKFESGNDGEHYYPRDAIYFKSTVGQGKRYHPQQKPVELLEYLIRTYTNEGELVLDATCGSGSTGVAAINTGRKFIGFELEKKFYDIAEKRIKEALAKKQQELF